MSDRLSAINEYNEKIVILLQNQDIPTISHTEFLIRRKFKPAFGLLSLFPIKDLDFNFYTSEYLNFPVIDLYQNYFIPSDISLLDPQNENGDINLWKFYNLLTGSNKTSYLDKFLDRGVNAFDFTTGVSDALDNRNSKHSWFLK